MRIAITGHRDLSGPTADKINTELRDQLPRLADGQPLVGITCLADGADTLFANAVLDLGGSIEAVIPATEYRDGLPAEAQPEYDRLLSLATKTTDLDYRESNSDAHMTASLTMLETADHLIAIWDGQPPRGPGGTADVVNAAKTLNLSTTIIWPSGAVRGDQGN